MEFIECDIDQEFIEKCFKEDPTHYLETYECKSHTLAEAVSDTVYKLNGLDYDGVKSKFFKINLGTDIGFFAINIYNGITCLTSFYIRKNYRILKTEFIEKLKSEYKMFKVPIYSTNHKAIGFLNKNGGEIESYTQLPDDLGLLIFNFKI
jgi:hypothetical protein